MIEAVNQAESVIHDIESKMDEFKDQLPPDEVIHVQWLHFHYFITFTSTVPDIIKFTYYYSTSTVYMYIASEVQMYYITP